MRHPSNCGNAWRKTDVIEIDVETLRIIGVVITGDRGWTVVRDDSKPTCSCTYATKTVLMSAAVVPEGLPQWKVNRLLEGEAAHEFGHAIITMPYAYANNGKVAPYAAWISSKRYPRLAHYVESILEDLRVNFYVKNRYRFDFGPRLEAIHIANTPAVLEFYKSMGSVFEKTVVATMILTLRDIDVTGDLSPAFAEAAKGSAAILKAAQFKRTARDLVKAIDQAYNLLEKLMPRDVNDHSIPNIMGGLARLTATKEQIDEAERERQAELKKQEEEAELKKQAEEGKEEEESPQVQVAAGVSTGAEEPHPKPDPAEYQRLVLRNMPHITALLNRLKVLQKTYFKVNRFTKHGRYMAELQAVWRSLSKSGGKPYSRRYEGREIQQEKLKVKMGLLVDVSGSMDTEQAKDVLTVIAETAGKWLPSGDFAIAVFGTNHAMIKTFTEHYRTTRARIGGVVCMANTNMARPLEVLMKMLASYRRTEYALVLVVVSDFYMGDQEDTKKILMAAERLGVRVIGVGLCSTDLERVRQYTARATYVDKVSELPSLFFTVYRATVSGQLR